MCLVFSTKFSTVHLPSYLYVTSLLVIYWTNLFRILFPFFPINIFSHNLPVLPSLHSHINPLRSSMIHWPWFWHGLGWQESLGLWHCLPEIFNIYQHQKVKKCKKRVFFQFYFKSNFLVRTLKYLLKSWKKNCPWKHQNHF